MAVILVVGTFNGSSAQEDFIFKGRIIDKGSERGVANIPVIIPGHGEARTQDDGSFQIAISAGLSQVDIEVPPEWSILYPVQGRTPVPRDPSMLTEIIVEERYSRLEQLERELARLRREKKLSEAQIDSLEQVVKDSVSYYQEQLRALELDRLAERDSIDARINGLTGRIEKDLVRQKQEELVGQLCQDLNRYLYRLKDLRDWMPRIEDVFLQENALENFNRTVSAYNMAWDTIYVNRSAYLDVVRRYWEDPSLFRETESVLGLALDDIHSALILPANKTVNKEIGDFATGQNSRISAQKRAKKNAGALINDLNLPVSTLEREIRNLCLELSATQ